MESVYDMSKELDKVNKTIEITNEKDLARKVLIDIMSIDPAACIAGGAPRDWERGNTCNDIDIFYETTTNDRWTMMAQLYRAVHSNIESFQPSMQAKMLGWQEDNVESLQIVATSVLGTIKDISADEQYDNSNVRAVFECSIATDKIDKKIQFICVKSTLNLFDFFDCSINCIRIGISEWTTDHWFTFSSTLHDAGKATNTIVFTEEVFNKGIDENKAFQRFIMQHQVLDIKNDLPSMQIGNERDVITRLINTQTSLPKVQCDGREQRHEYYTDMPF